VKKLIKFCSILLILVFLTSIFTSSIQFDGNRSIDDSEIQLEYQVPSTDAYFTIIGDAQLASIATTDPTHGGGGYGNATHPYILENYSVDLSSSNLNGILIQNTTKHFVLRNCYMRAPKLWYAGADPYGGYLFLNVTNGRVEFSEAIGYPIGSNLWPTLWGFWVEECVNFTIARCDVPNNYLTQFSPVVVGIAVYFSKNVTIKNCNIRAELPIELYSSLNVHVHNNFLSGPSGYPEGSSRINLDCGMRLQFTNESIVENNIIDINNAGTVGNEATGIMINGFKNIIVSNNIQNLNIGWYIRELVIGHNSYIKLISPPDNANYVGPESPSAGYYPNSGLFETYADGYYDNSNWIWWPEPQLTDNSTTAMIANKTDAGGYDHKKVLEFHTWDGLAYFEDLHMMQTIPLSGTYEFWFAKEDLGSGAVEFQLGNGYYSDPCTFSIVLEDDVFKFRDNMTLNNTGVPALENKWYRLSIDFCGDNSEYAGLGLQECQFRIHDSDGSRLLYRSSAIEFLNGPVVHFQVKVQTDGVSNLTVFIDAPGYSWDPLYEVGDNANEGLLLQLAAQNVGIDHYWCGYSLDGQPLKLGFASSAMIRPTKKVIPLPDSDGTHSIQFTGNYSMINKDGTRYPPAIFSTKPLSFTLRYFNTYLDIVTHTENGEEVPPGLSSLTSSQDLNVSLTFKTRLGTEPDTMATWTNVSSYYKINNTPWNGPYSLGYWYGLKNVSFIISKGLFHSFDHIYYYFAFQQYDNDSRYLDSYYWTRESYEQGALQYDEWLARSTAFHKKVAPIAYDLSLDYSVFYYSQVESTLPHISGINITTYPMVGVTTEQIQVDFYNLTSDLTIYGIGVQNSQSNLNYTMVQATSNISTTIDPLFNYNQGIKSPFILPLSLSLTEGANYTFPEMLFDGLASDRNLTFTGTLLNLIYRGVEDHWPYSWRSVLKFSSTADKTIIRYDQFTRIMIYYESLNETIPNGAQKMVFALVENNADYPSNLVIDKRAEVVYEDMYIIPTHLLAIVYDPPGDHSYGQFKSGTTMTVGFQVETETEVEDTFDFSLNILGFEISDYIQEAIGCEDYQNITVEGTLFDTVAEITFQKTLTSAINSDNASFMGHGGGDLYYGSGLLVHYYIMQFFHYIVIGNESQTSVAASRDLPNQQVDDILVWNSSLWVDYILQ